MALLFNKQEDHKSTQVLAMLAGGLVVGLASAVLLSAFAWLYLIIVMAGLLTFVLMFFAKEVPFYWLGVYILFLPIEAGKRITNMALSSQDILNAVGLPPSGDLGFKVYPTDLALLALVIPWVFRLVTKREQLYFPRVNYLLIGILVWSLIGILLKAPHVSLSFAQFFQECKYFIVYLYVCNNFKNDKVTRYFLWMLLLTLFLESLAAVVMHHSGLNRDTILSGLNVSREYTALLEEEHPDDADERESGTLGSASNLALYIQLVSALPIALLFTSIEKRIQVFCVVLTALMMYTLYLTGSRAGLLGCQAGVLSCLVLLRLRGYFSVRQVVAVVFVVASILLLAGPKLYTYMTSRPEPFSHRFTLMEEGAKLIADNPVLGVGLNNSTVARLKAYGSKTADDFYAIHNQFIVLTAETGIVGLLLNSAFFLTICGLASRLSKHPDRHIACLGIGVLSGFIALATQLTGDHFVGNVQHTTLWLFVGLIVAVSRMVDNETAASTQVSDPAYTLSHRHVA